MIDGNQFLDGFQTLKIQIAFMLNYLQAYYLYGFDLVMLEIVGYRNH